MEAQAEVSVLSNEKESSIAKLSTCEMERNQLLYAHDKLKEKNGSLERELENCLEFGKEFEAKIISLELELESVKAILQSWNACSQSMDVDLGAQQMISAQGVVGIIKGHVSPSKALTSKDKSTEDFKARARGCVAVEEQGIVE
ncbi:hypothetical protein LOK49_LG13G00676 [Camellia lanceoleosa]|uniref:Uncharacterized protein n=1 Tax=Camellia lanceoleosa TaxID=1840588 RepID=A0ACC0FH99_9ERIC|nr:hypothetical protein LOK49_LG13G00676 [Camellia lanceoleosa]